MAEKILWLSRHKMSPAQKIAMEQLHGANVGITHDSDFVFQRADDLHEVVEMSMKEGYNRVYAVAPAHMIVYLCAIGTDSMLKFGMFENDPVKRTDGQFGLSKVYWLDVEPGKEQKLYMRGVWTNTAPQTDNGDKLIPVERK